MEEGQGYGEPGRAPPEAQPAPTYALAPAQSAPPAAPSHGRANAALVAAVIALVIALIGVVMFPGPIGDEGSEGPQGTAGQDGDDGQDGDTGLQGPVGSQGPAGTDGVDGIDGTNGTDGTDGLDGIACWDLNGNGTGDLPAEDINSDLVVDVNDCTGQDGTDGLDGIDGLNGINCWDLNQNGIPDLATEDINGDMVVDVLDCAGSTGPPGPGTIMAWSSLDLLWQITGVCDAYVGLSVTLTVPADGFIVVSSTIVSVLDHTSGIRDIVYFRISQLVGDCVDDQWLRLEVITDNQPSDFYWPTTYTDLVEPVTAGTYTFFLNAAMSSGASASDSIWRASMIAVFYPS